MNTIDGNADGNGMQRVMKAGMSGAVVVAIHLAHNVTDRRVLARYQCHVS